MSRPPADDPEKDQLRERLTAGAERIDSLEQQLATANQQIAEKDSRLASLEQLAFRVRNAADARRFLDTPSFLRLITVGARGALALLWTPVRTEGLPAAGLPQGTVGRWLQADALAAHQPARADAPWFAWPVQPPEGWHCRVKLSDANYYTPTPTGYTQAISLLYIDFELFYDVGRLSPARLLAVLQALEAVFGDVAGRCSVRYGGGRLYLDVWVLGGGAGVGKVCAAIHAVLPGHVACLHKGKAQVDVAPIRRRERG